MGNFNSFDRKMVGEETTTRTEKREVDNNDYMKSRMRDMLLYAQKNNYKSDELVGFAAATLAAALKTYNETETKAGERCDRFSVEVNDTRITVEKIK